MDPKPPIGSVFLFYILISIYFFKYEIIVRTSAWSFVNQNPIQVVCNIYTVLGVDSNVCTIGGNSIRETGHNLSKGSPHWGTADF